MKTCNTCKQTLSLDRFSKDNCKPDKLCLYCKACVIARGRKFREDHPGYDREYYLTNKLRIQERIEKYHAANIERMTKYQTEYRRINRDKINQKRREKRET